MRKKILIVAAVLLLINAVPASASLYFDWIDPLPQIQLWPFSVGEAYNTQDNPKGWLDIQQFDDDFWSDVGPGMFILKSNSGQLGLVPVKIKTTFSADAHVSEENATNTKFHYFGLFRGFNIRSLDGLYNRNFDLPSIDLNETSYRFISSSSDGINTDTFLSYSQTDSFLDFFEIGKPYGIMTSLVGAGLWGSATPIDPNIYGDSFVTNFVEQDTTLHVVPEPSTMLLLGAGLLGGVRLRRRSISV